MILPKQVLGLNEKMANGMDVSACRMDSGLELMKFFLKHKEMGLVNNLSALDDTEREFL